MTLRDWQGHIKMVAAVYCLDKGCPSISGTIADSEYDEFEDREQRYCLMEALIGEYWESQDPTTTQGE